jgi:hypothetical protein
MKVKYLDLETGEKAEEDGISRWQLTEGNWSCDCNRQLAFDRDSDTCKSERYIVYDVEEEGSETFELLSIEEIIREANSKYYFKLRNQ